jgi:hypothetical protein
MQVGGEQGRQTRRESHAEHDRRGGCDSLELAEVAGGGGHIDERRPTLGRHACQAGVLHTCGVHHDVDAVQRGRISPQSGLVQVHRAVCSCWVAARSQRGVAVRPQFVDDRGADRPVPAEHEHSLCSHTPSRYL